MKSKSIIILVIALILIGAGIFLVVKSLSKPTGGDVCTQDAQECPDGSFVGRNANNNCEFYDCPTGGGSSGGTFPEGTSPQTYNVEIRNYLFFPSTLTIQVGDTVIWTNAASVHTVTSDSGNELDSETLSSGETYSHTFTTIGNFDYHCTLHPTMKGTINVE